MQRVKGQLVTSRDSNGKGQPTPTGMKKNMDPFSVKRHNQQLKWAGFIKTIPHMLMDFSD
jgi:hypothetical protein